MKFTLNVLEKSSDDNRKGHSPGHIFGGRVRTSTLVLIVLLLAVWWTYDTYKPQPASHEGPSAPQVVPPGFVPDPNYTWVPRTRVQQQPTETYTPPPTPTTTTPPPPPPVTTTTPPPFVLPTLPCIPPFCTPSTTPAPSPLPGVGPVPTPLVPRS